MSCSTSPRVKCLYSVTIMNELLKKFVHSLCLGVEKWCSDNNGKEKNASTIT